MSTTTNQVKEFEETGFIKLSPSLTRGELSDLKNAFNNLNLRKPGTRHSSIPNSFLEKIINIQTIVEAASRLLKCKANLVRIIAFNKTPEINWGVPWHQDRTIAVKEKHDTPNFGPWSRKDGIWHVEPPKFLMNHMVTLRVHLDPCAINNGPLQLLPGSYKLGRVTQKNVIMQSKEISPHICIMNEGDILAMHALTIHKSAKADTPTNRRVLHLEFCSQKLPKPLEWAITH